MKFRTCCLLSGLFIFTLKPIIPVMFALAPPVGYLALPNQNNKQSSFSRMTTKTTNPIMALNEYINKHIEIINTSIPQKQKEILLKHIQEFQKIIATQDLTSVTTKDTIGRLLISIAYVLEKAIFQMEQPQEQKKIITLFHKILSLTEPIVIREHYTIYDDRNSSNEMLQTIPMRKRIKSYNTILMNFYGVTFKEVITCLETLDQKKFALFNIDLEQIIEPDIKDKTNFWDIFLRLNLNMYDYLPNIARKGLHYPLIKSRVAFRIIHCGALMAAFQKQGNNMAVSLPLKYTPISDIINTYILSWESYVQYANVYMCEKLKEVLETITYYEKNTLSDEQIGLVKNQITTFLNSKKSDGKTYLLMEILAGLHSLAIRYRTDPISTSKYNIPKNYISIFIDSYPFYLSALFTALKKCEISNKEFLNTVMQKIYGLTLDEIVAELYQCTPDDSKLLILNEPSLKKFHEIIAESATAPDRLVNAFVSTLLRKKGAIPKLRSYGIAKLLHYGAINILTKKTSPKDFPRRIAGSSISL